MSKRIILGVILCWFCQLLDAQGIIDEYGALIRSDTTVRRVYLCFTGHDFHDGFKHVLQELHRKEILASFFLTGDFVRNHPGLVTEIHREGHYVGAHSDKHLLYCDWSLRDSLLHSPEMIREDIRNNLRELSDLGIYSEFFMPPYEWYNREVVILARELGQKTINFSPGTRSNADYTTPEMNNYLSSTAILQSIYHYEEEQGMKGFHLLIHPGVSPLRTDKLYHYLDEILAWLSDQGYRFSRF